MEHSVAHLFQYLQESVGPHLLVTLNNNRSTMLSVRWEPKCTKVSLHKMFLKAPPLVVDALAGYLKERKKKIPQSIKAFIGSHASSLDHTHLVDPKELSTEGKYVKLCSVYHNLNNFYFHGKLNLRITWFGDAVPKNRAKISLGLYYDSMRLVKIHRLLDNPIVPLYVIEYIVYHEMLHSVCPPDVNEEGICRVHGRKFKALERCFYRYLEAKSWLKKHQKQFFVRGR